MSLLEIVLRGGIVVDPSQQLHDRVDILVRDGVVAQLAPFIATEGRVVEDVSGLVVTPGLIDVHTHLREPGGEAKETILTGSQAAAAGGYTSILAMPNTQPVCDDAETVELIRALAKQAGLVRVLPVGAITRESRGQELADISRMVEHGVCAITDDGRGVQSAELTRLAMGACALFNIPLLEHCEDESLAGKGQIHTGTIAEKLQLTGISVSSETVMLARDVLLAQETKARVHIMHVSCKDAVEIIRFAKSCGLSITAEVTPHHLLLTETAVDGYNTLAKMKPPLRTDIDREALRAALADGTIDIIATDHAPHTADEKNSDFVSAPFGIVGLETAFALMYTHFVKTALLSLDTLIDKMACRPAGIFRLPYGTLALGSPADIAVFDLRQEKVIDKARFYSKGKNTPFHGWKVSGIPVLTMVGGKIIMRDGLIL